MIASLRELRETVLFVFYTQSRHKTGRHGVPQHKGSLTEWLNSARLPLLRETLRNIGVLKRLFQRAFDLFGATQANCGNFTFAVNEERTRNARYAIQTSRS